MELEEKELQNQTKDIPTILLLTHVEQRKSGQNPNGMYRNPCKE